MLQSLQKSFNEMQTWITELKQLGPQNIVLAITGNKSDLEAKRKVRALSPSPPHPPSSCDAWCVVLQVSKATGEAFAKNSNALFVETSAKDGSNVHDLFRTIGILPHMPFLYLSLPPPQLKHYP